MEFQVSDMPSDDMKLVASQCGVSVALSLMEKLGGVAIYIPSPTKLTKKQIIEEYDGTNAKAIAIKLSVSVTFVKKTLREAGKI